MQIQWRSLISSRSSVLPRTRKLTLFFREWKIDNSLPTNGFHAARTAPSQHSTLKVHRFSCTSNILIYLAKLPFPNCAPNRAPTTCCITRFTGSFWLQLIPPPGNLSISLGFSQRASYRQWPLWRAIIEIASPVVYVYSSTGYVCVVTTSKLWSVNADSTREVCAAKINDFPFYSSGRRHYGILSDRSLGLG